MSEKFKQTVAEKKYEEAAKRLRKNSTDRNYFINEFFTSDYRQLQQLSKVLEKMERSDQHILFPYFKEWVRLLEKPHHDAFQRNTYRYFQYAKLPADFHGIIYNLAYKDMKDISNPVAVRVFAMTTCFNIAQIYKDLLPELKEAIDIVSQSESAGIQARCRMLLKKIE